MEYYILIREIGKSSPEKNFVFFYKFFGIFRFCGNFLYKELPKKVRNLNEVGILRRFDSCVKQSINYATKFYLRTKYRRHEKEISFSNLSIDETILAIKDKYCFEYSVIFDAVICDELLFEAINQLNPKARKVIILKYWHDMTDEEIGKILNLGRTSVNYNKHAALKTLKKTIMELNKNDERIIF